MLELLMYSVGFATILTVAIYWFYFKRQVNELKDTVQDKKIIINSLINHQNKIEKDEVKIVKTTKTPKKAKSRTGTKTNTDTTKTNQTKKTKMNSGERK